LVRPDNGGVEEEAGFIDLDGQLLEGPFPDAALRPPVEPVVHGLPGAGALGQVSPGDAGPGSPDNGVDEVAVSSFGDPTRSNGEKALNALPLSIAQFVSMHGKC
jgi:hypothetical protein